MYWGHGGIHMLIFRLDALRSKLRVKCGVGGQFFMHLKSVKKAKNEENAKFYKVIH